MENSTPLTKEMEERIRLVLDLEGDGDIRSIRSFEEDMVLTRNNGLVVKMMDGIEFQITIVQSR